MKKRAVAIIIVAVLVVVGVLTFVVLRQRVRRQRVFRPAGEARPAALQPGIPPVVQWTATFASLPPKELAELLAQIETKQPEQYRKWSLAYVHGRALLESGEADDAAQKLTPFLAASSPFRELALYHQSTIADGAEASRLRNELLGKYPDSPYRQESIDAEVEYLSSLGRSQPLIDFATKIAPSASTERRRELSARVVEALVAEKNLNAALTRGLALLNGGTTDDASDRTSRALDRPELLARMTAEQWALLGQSFQSHRHYDRAVALLQKALAAAPKTAAPVAKPVAAKKVVAPATKKKAPAKKPAKGKKAPVKKAPAKAAAKKPAAPPPAPPKSRLDRDDLQFAIGRSYFGNEQYVEAQNVYLQGANTTRQPDQKATFYWHAARAAQLRGDDATAEKLMTAAIGVPGNYPSTKAALTQRIRTRIKQKRIAQAGSDLALLRKMAPNDRAILDGTLAYGVGLLAAGNTAGAESAFNSIPVNLRDPYDKAEIVYWRARALEQRDPPASFRAYLEVLRADVPSHFAYFARTRLDAPAMAPKLARELAVREAEVARLVAAKNYALAKEVQTDRILLSSRDRAGQLEKLAAIYRELPTYHAVLKLEPAELPHFPLEDTSDRSTLLMAMGLSDEAVPAIERRWGLAPAAAALTRSYALNQAAASKDSIYAIEVMMKRVPTDFVPDLLPEVVRQLLYPRYFYDAISADAKRYEADPALVLSIMREESRFNPRAKSQAAARGLLQFIITTARDIGRDVGLVDVDPEDLYDPRVIIQLGAKYIAELTKTFGGNRYRASGAYNAGPKQVALWARMQAGEGDDYFLTAINFEETKHYVRKVMNSYERYEEIYGHTGPAGGLRAEP